MIGCSRCSREGDPCGIHAIIPEWGAVWFAAGCPPLPTAPDEIEDET